VAQLVVGFDPAEAMVHVAKGVCPGARFLAAAGEAIPLPDASVDLLAAAGSLNYANDLAAVWPEAARILTRDGVFAVYDFSPGRRFEHADTLDQWFTAFTARYPYPASQAIPLSPDILATLATPFSVTRAETFAFELRLGQEFYLSYMLTETNVQAAVEAGASLADIRKWCDTTLTPVFAGRPQPVVFTGYLTHLEPVR
jgi:SAM-dependent methyltransferase